MKRIGIRELRQNASEYVRIAQGGGTVEICDRGTAVALLVPLPAADGLERLKLLGRLSGAEGDLLDLGSPLEPTSGEPLPSEVLLARRDGER